MKINWWKWLPFQRWRLVGTADDADEIPASLPRNGVVLVGTNDRPKWIVFDCACRRGHRIMLNADTNRRPYWTLQSQHSLTVWPSIDYLGEARRCHYFLRSGRVSWARDSDR